MNYIFPCKHGQTFFSKNICFFTVEVFDWTNNQYLKQLIINSSYNITMLNYVFIF